MRDALSVPQYVELYPEVPPHMLPKYPWLAPDRMMVPIVRGGNLCCPYPGGFALASVWDVSLWEGRLWPIRTEPSRFGSSTTTTEAFERRGPGGRSPRSGSWSPDAATSTSATGRILGSAGNSYPMKPCIQEDRVPLNNVASVSAASSSPRARSVSTIRLTSALLTNPVQVMIASTPKARRQFVEAPSLGAGAFASRLSTF